MKKLSILVGVLILAAVGWYLLSPIWRVQVLNEDSPLVERGTPPSETTSTAAEMRVLARALFVAKAHDVAGTALLIKRGEKSILRFENFETINGPDLHIYLSADLEGKDYIDLGSIRATKGNVNYDLPVGIDTNKYRHVLVWCVPFKVLFSFASF